MGQDTALAPLENLFGVYPSIFARKCRIKLTKILNLTKRIIRQNRSVSLCIIEETGAVYLRRFKHGETIKKSSIFIICLRFWLSYLSSSLSYIPKRKYSLL